ncbi:MAG: hypothetical protein O2856_01060 [Planctomycetota bacterium]|nr:hypothetical protein [Planctomycetota bacterium]
MEIVLMLIGLLAIVAGIGSLACWIMVIIAAFKNEQSPLMGILCIVLCGLGAFIIGWIKHGEWKIKNIMLAWTGLIVFGVIIQVVAGVLAGAAAVAAQ